MAWLEERGELKSFERIKAKMIGFKEGESEWYLEKGKQGMFN